MPAILWNMAAIGKARVNGNGAVVTAREGAEGAAPFQCGIVMQVPYTIRGLYPIFCRF
jgi:hypothetical protein